MDVTPLLQGPAISSTDYRCTASAADQPFVEQHSRFSLSYVRKGSFGCQTRGKSYELVAGSLLIGYPEDEFICTHEHHAGGDECLSFGLPPELVDVLGGGTDLWRIAVVPPLLELVAAGECAQASAEGRTDMSLEEAGTLLVARFVACLSEKQISVPDAAPRNRRRAIEIALWIDENAQEPASLEAIARQAGLSRFHFLRVFRETVGLTPHQYLVRCRLRRAVRLMTDEDRSITEIAFESGFGDLANFIRTFRRASGLPPAAFRRMGDLRCRRDAQGAIA
jgi:AraC-like DNA-binding protein